MAIDFPASPTLNQTFSVGNTNYIWDGTKWTASVTGGIALDKIQEGNTSAEVVDTGSDGRFVVTTEGTERLRVTSAGLVGVGTTAFPASTPIQVKAVGAGSGGYAIVSANDENAGGVILNASSENSIRIEADPGNLRGSSYINLSVDGTERARIDSSGRLLVGTSSTSKARTIIAQGNSGNANDGGVLQLSTGLATPANGDTLGYLMFADSSHDQGAQILGQRDGGTWSASSKPSRLVFSTTADGASSPTERMRITNDGYALFNTTNKALRDSTSDVGLSIDPGAGGLLQLAAGGPTYFNRVSSDGSIIAFRRNGANVGSISVTGSATAYNTSSDYRLKENVTAVTDGIVRLQQLKPSRFNFIADPSTTVDGFIAHEVQTVVPEAIYGEKDEVDSDGNPIYQGIDQSKLVPLLTAALQEAVAKIESLEARLTAAGI